MLNRREIIICTGTIPFIPLSKKEEEKTKIFKYVRPFHFLHATDLNRKYHSVMDHDGLILVIPDKNWVFEHFWHTNGNEHYIVERGCLKDEYFHKTNDMIGEFVPGRTFTRDSITYKYAGKKTRAGSYVSFRKRMYEYYVKKGKSRPVASGLAHKDMMNSKNRVSNCKF